MKIERKDGYIYMSDDSGLRFIKKNKVEETVEYEITEDTQHTGGENQE